MSDVTIPEDVKRQAQEALEGWQANLRALAYPVASDQAFYFLRHVEAAILAERERAAKIAADNINAWSLRIGEGQTLADFIAQAIRFPHE